MAQYINKTALVAEIERKINEINLDNIEDWRCRIQREHDIEVMKNILSLIDTLEVKEGKQIIIITESDGDAHIHWDCRSLEDVNILLDYAKSFIIDRQTEGVRGRGSFPDYNTEEGRYKDLFAKSSEVKEVDLEKEYDNEFFKDPVFGKLVNRNAGISIAKHFFELGIKSQTKDMIEALRTEYEKGRHDVIGKTLKWLWDLNQEHEIMSYTDSHVLDSEELQKYYKNNIEE